MAVREWHLNRTGPNVKELLIKIEDLKDATIYSSGTMTAGDKRKLDQLVNDEPLSILEIDELLNF